ncbi:MAG TPA: hypothetical protein VNR36_13515 [Pseudolysinimonas sp.]|nr:hypothetical protein [Pseudolysinimonas sp.]
MADTSPRKRYVVVSAVLVAAGAVAGPIIRGESDVTFTLPDGVTAFAVLFVLATALERLNVILVPLFDWVLGALGGGDGSAGTVKTAALSNIRQARLAAMNLAPAVEGFAATAASLDDDAEKVTRSNTEKALLTTALAFTVGILGISLLKFSLMNSIGYFGVPAGIDVLVTAAAISGGAAGLGDLISKIQKSKTTQETGGVA